MKNIKFNGGNLGGEKVCCDESQMPKEQRIDNAKSSLKYIKKRISDKKLEMESLALLTNSYTYNSEYLALMVGQCFMEITEAKERKSELKKTIKQLKSKKAK